MLEDFLQHSASHYSQFNGWKNFRMFQCNSRKISFKFYYNGQGQNGYFSWIQCSTLLLRIFMFCSPIIYVQRQFYAQTALENLLSQKKDSICFCFSTRKFVKCVASVLVHRRWKLQPCEVMGLCKWCCLLFITVQTLEQPFSNL